MQWVSEVALPVEQKLSAWFADRQFCTTTSRGAANTTWPSPTGRVISVGSSSGWPTMNRAIHRSPSNGHAQPFVANSNCGPSATTLTWALKAGA